MPIQYYSCLKRWTVGSHLQSHSARTWPFAHTTPSFHPKQTFPGWKVRSHINAHTPQHLAIVLSLYLSLAHLHFRRFRYPSSWPPPNRIPRKPTLGSLGAISYGLESGIRTGNWELGKAQDTSWRSIGVGIGNGDLYGVAFCMVNILGTDWDLALQ